MSYVLSKASYESAESLVKKDLLAYIDYGSPQGSRIFSWPQYVIENDTVSPIDPSTFPDVGCLPMTVAGGFQEKGLFGSLCGLISGKSADGRGIIASIDLPQKKRPREGPFPHGAR